MSKKKVQNAVEMSPYADNNSETPTKPTAVPNDGVTAGDIMRRAREAAKLDISTLATALKVSEKKIEALETSRFDLLPSAVFYRSLAASVCKYLNIDPAPVLEKLPKNTAPQFEEGVWGINQPFQRRSDVWHFSGTSLLSKPATWIVLVLLLGSMIIVLLPEQKVAGLAQLIHKSPNTPPVEEVSSEEVSPNPVMPPPVVESETTPPTVVITAAPPPILAPIAPIAPVAVASVPISSAASAIAKASQPSSTPVATAVVDGLIRFKAKGSVWIQVTDAKGKTQLSKALVAGDVAAASGATPLSVVVGRADAVDVEVRGAPFNLTPVAKENIAKFEVK